MQIFVAWLQRSVTQSEFVPQLSPTLHFVGQTTPQSSSASKPFLKPSLQVGEMQIEPTQLPLSQSMPTLHFLPSEHFSAQLPPQLMSVSLPFCVLSLLFVQQNWPSSVTPLQSSSVPSQSSASVFGWTFGTHFGVVSPISHFFVPAWQGVAAYCGRKQTSPTPLTPSSFCPLQSSSRPLQISTVGIFWPVQVLNWPFTQACLPGMQVPCPAVPGGPS